MKPWIIQAGLALTLAPMLAVGDWQHTVSPYGLRTAQVTATGQTPNGETTTTLTVQCHPAKDGAVNLIYTVDHVAQIKAFNFDDFEGPDAPAAERKLGTLRVVSPKGEVVVKTRFGGYYAESDVFAFSLSAKAHVTSDVTRMTDAIARGATAIAVSVQDSRTNDKHIQTTFPVTDAQTAMRETMQGCGPRKR